MNDPLNGEQRADLNQRIKDMIEAARLYHSCVSCQHFSEEKELCCLFNARPPARVIAFGCERWMEEPPF